MVDLVGTEPTTRARDPEGAGSAGMVLNTILIDPKTGVLWGAGGVATW